MELSALQGYNYSVDINAEGFVEISISLGDDTEKIIVENSHFKDKVGPKLRSDDVVTVTTTEDTISFTFTESLHVKDDENYILVNTNLATASDLMKMTDSSGNVYPLTNVGVALSQDRTVLTFDFSEHILVGVYTIEFSNNSFYDEIGNAIDINYLTLIFS